MGLLEQLSSVVPQVDSHVSMARPSMLSIYGVSRGFNQHSLVSLTDLFSGSRQGFDA
jgi:hypothetical protein